MKPATHSRWSLNLGSISGIKIYVHWTFLILVFWVMFSGKAHGQSFAQIGYTVLFLFAVFVCVTLHELGHALVAKRYKCITRNILLLPIGGIAQMERLPEKPKEEMAVAIAGPLVNAVIAAVFYFTVLYGTVLPEFKQLSIINGQTFVLNLFVINVMLVAFNMIPAFPMDGGRVLRALLSLKYKRYKATRIAATIGQFIAIIFVFIGLFSNPFLVFIGMFIFIGAQIEAEFYESKHFLESYKVRDVTMQQYQTLEAGNTLAEAIQKLLDMQATNFLVTDNGIVTGTLSRNEIIKALSQSGNTVLVKNVMNKDVQFLDADQKLEDVYILMRMKSSVLSPVMDNGKMLGVVDLDNILEFIMVQEAMEKNVHLKSKSSIPV